MFIGNIKDNTHGIYIGRGTPLGNPYEIGKDGDRDAVIGQYRDYLLKELALANPVLITALKQLSEDSILRCHCSPAKCHGEVIEEAFFLLSKFMPKPTPLTYAGIGARKTPGKALDYMTKIARRLDELGYTLRSGGAKGADQAFAAGSTRKEEYLPWKGYEENGSAKYGVTTEALKLAELMHPTFTRLSQGAQKLMSRNGYQILGEDLRSPSEMVICWTEDGCESNSTRTRKTGGTGQAIELASHYDIPVFNLKNPDVMDRLRIKIEENKQFDMLGPS